MAHDTILQRCFLRVRGISRSASRTGLQGCAPLLAGVLGALACGDGAAGTAPAEAEPGSAEVSAPSAAAPSPAPAPAETVSTPTAPAGADGASEGVGSNPIMLGAGSPLPSAGGGEGTPGDAPANEPPADAEPSATSLIHGADPTQQSATSPGPFQVTTLTTGLRDGPDYGSQTLHVPEGAEPPFAAVVIVPGFNTLESSIQAWGPFLASHGIVALTIGTNTPTDSADARTLALLDALETIKAENARAGSPLEGNLALDHLGIMGWSLGGAGVLRAASSTPSLKAAITMAAFSPGGQFASDQVPTLFIAGSADPNAGGQSQGLFASLPETTPKMLFEVRGGPHEIGNDPANADGEIGRYGLSWLELFLVGDERYRPFLEVTPTQASDFQQNLISNP
jgi:dienelactone hydrolase